MRALFHREAALEEELRRVRAEIGAERQRFADKHSFRIFPGLDTLRRQFGAAL